MSKIGNAIIEEMERTGRTTEEIMEKGFDNENSQH